MESKDTAIAQICAVHAARNVAIMTAIGPFHAYPQLVHATTGLLACVHLPQDDLVPGIFGDPNETTP